MTVQIPIGKKRPSKIRILSWNPRAIQTGMNREQWDCKYWGHGSPGKFSKTSEWFYSTVSRIFFASWSVFWPYNLAFPRMSFKWNHTATGLFRPASLTFRSACETLVMMFLPLRCWVVCPFTCRTTTSSCWLWMKDFTISCPNRTKVQGDLVIRWDNRHSLGLCWVTAVCGQPTHFVSCVMQNGVFRALQTVPSVFTNLPPRGAEDQNGGSVYIGKFLQMSDALDIYSCFIRIFRLFKMAWNPFTKLLPSAF